MSDLQQSQTLEMINKAKTNILSAETFRARPARCRRPARSFPSPRPSPIGRGRMVRRSGVQSQCFERSQRREGNRNIDMSKRIESCSLPMNTEEHSTSNVQHRTSNGRANPRSLRRSMFDVGRSMFFLGSGVSTREFSFRGNLSLRERVRVRGNESMIFGKLRPFPATVELHASSGRAGGFPI